MPDKQEVLEMLEELEDYLDPRADVETFSEYGPIENEEMKLLIRVKELKERLERLG